MDKKRQQKIYELLKRGIKLVESSDELPAEWAREFFPPERREYELVYNGKETEEQILADTMAVPFQSASTFGQNGVDWHNKIIFGDNLQTMKTLLQMKTDGKLVNADGTPGIRLIYIDPPFATKKEFRGSQDQKAYQDKIAGAEFLEFLRKRLVIMRELLASDGSIYIHLDWKKGHYAKILLDEIFGENNFVREIIWDRMNPSGGKAAADNWIHTHDTIYFYSKSQTSKVFNKQYEPYSDKYISKRFVHEDEKGKYRLQGSDNRKQYLHESKGRALTSVWSMPDINVMALEKTGFPTQKPETLLERIMMASSNEGDIVLDAFSGGGTTAAVAEKLSRRWIAIDVGKLSIYTTQKRMLTLRKKIGNTGDKLEPKPFTLYNAGLYDS